MGLPDEIHGAHRGAQILTRHHIREAVVVDHGRVLVGASDVVDAEGPLPCARRGWKHSDHTAPVHFLVCGSKSLSVTARSRGASQSGCLMEVSMNQG